MIETTNFIKQQPRCLITSDPGTGKTRAVLDALDPTAGATLVLAPLSILEASWVEDIIKFRLKGTTIGFNSNLNDNSKMIGQTLNKLENRDLLKFGMIPEFIGRLPIITTLSELDKEMLVKIMTEPKNALIKQFQSLFKMDGIVLEFKSDALIEIANLAVEQNTGARGLRSIIEDTLMNLMYSSPDTKDLFKIVINKDVVTKKSDPILIFSNKQNNQKILANNS